MSRDALTEGLRHRGVHGVSAAPRSLKRLSRDFGGIASATPALLVRPSSSDEISACLRFAAERELTVTTRGSGHSCGGQTLRPGSLVLRLPHRTPRICEPGLVEVSGGSTWRQVESFLHPKGQTIPVLADYLGLSVGGTLSVGCYGVDSIAQGAQVHHVDRLLLVRPDGEQVWCSRNENEDLFRFALAGLGQVGVIDRVVMRTVDHDPFVALHTYRYTGLREMLDSWQWLAEQSDESPVWFKASYSRRRCYSVFGVPARTRQLARRTTGPRALADRKATRLVSGRYRDWRSLAVQAWLALYPRRRRLWSDYLFDWQGLREFARHLEQLLAQSRYSHLMACAYMLAIRVPEDTTAFPFEASGGVEGELKFGIGIYSMIPPGDDAALAAWRELSRRCLEACVSIGGRPYLYGWHEPQESELESLYGAARDQLLELNRPSDPRGAFLSPMLFPNRDGVR